MTDELDDARVLASLGRILSAGDPYTGLPLLDPDTLLFPAPVVEAVLEPITEQKGAADGIAELDGDALVPVAQIPLEAIAESEPLLATIDGRIALGGVGSGGAGILPTFRIATAGGAPIVSTDTYVDATYTLSLPGEGVETGGLRIRGRGNYTWALPKKPYRLNFDTATAPLGMTALQRNWALLANHDDPRKIANITGFTLGTQMDGLTWTPEFRCVELVLNDDFLGLYLLTDLVRLEAGRVPGAEVDGVTGDGLTGTWLAEISRRYIAEGDPGFTTSQEVMIQFEDPEVDLASLVPDEVTQAEYFRDFIQTFENALYSPDFITTADYAQYVDMQSFVDWWLCNELGSNQDSSFESSAKLWKERDSDGGRLHMGPLWDFGISFGNVVNVPHATTGWYTIPGANWIHRMLSDPTFKALALTRWTVLKTFIPNLLDTVDEYINLQGPANDRDVRRWGLSPEYASNSASYVKAWITARAAWIDANIAAVTGAGPVTPDAEAPTTPTGLVASAITETSFTLTWTASTDNIGVTSYRYRIDGGTPVSVGLTLTTNITGRTASTDYDLEVSARDAAGNWSSWSTPLTVPTAAPGVWTEVARNYCNNPSIEVTLAGYSETGTVTRTSEWSLDGDWSVKWGGGPTGDGAFIAWSAIQLDALPVAPIAGAVLTFSAYIRLIGAQTSPDARARSIILHDKVSPGGYVVTQSNVAPNSAGVTRLVLTRTFPVGTDDWFLRLYSGASTSDYAWFDNMMVNVGDTAMDYFDGDTPDTSTERYSWAGTPGQSVSIKEVLT